MLQIKMSTREAVAENGFFDPFPFRRVKTFIDCFGEKAEKKLFPPRDPHLVAQQIMLSLHFWPTEPEEDFVLKSESLRQCLSLTQGQIIERFSPLPDRDLAIERARARFLQTQKKNEDWEAKLERDNSSYPKGNDPLERIYQIYGQGELPFSQWKTAYLFDLWRYYRKAVHFGCDLLTNSRTPFLSLASFEQVWPKESFFSHYQADTEGFHKEWEIHHRKIERGVWTHGLKGLRLRLQIFLKALGDFSTCEFVSLSQNRIFLSGSKLFDDASEKWTMIFDSEEIEKSGLPCLAGGEAGEEREVRILPPIDLSLCLGVFPTLILKELNWEETGVSGYPNQRVIIIPEVYQKPQRITKILRETCSKLPIE